ncbi:MAG: hypothetical protein K0R84_1344 [Clostridia bacterium]|jgi:hypothetical protein|nr:hypothetical protein [Clostridia bacterium]
MYNKTNYIKKAGIVKYICLAVPAFFLNITTKAVDDNYITILYEECIGMNTINSIDQQKFQNYQSYAAQDRSKDNPYGFRNVLIRQSYEDIIDRFHNYGKGISVPPAVLGRLDSGLGSLFEDVTYDEEYEHLHEYGPYKLFRTYLDNGEGNGEKAVYLIRLKTRSKDTNIDKDKLKDILNKAMIIVKKMVPIYAKMNGNAILAGVDYTLPFNETTGKVDFEGFIKHLIEGTSSLAIHSTLDDETKEEIQRMLKECEDFLLKALDDNGEQETKPDVAEKCSVSIEYRNKLY